MSEQILDDRTYGSLLKMRAEEPEAVLERATGRKRRPLLRDDGNLLILAVDHAARGILGVGDDPYAMADRRLLLDHTIRALRRPGVDGVMATPEIVDDLLLLDELNDMVVFGSMNRGGLAGAAWELDDRFTGYDAASIARFRLEGGKMLLRIDYEDPASLSTLEACASAVTDLASRELVAMVEPLPAFRDTDGRVRISSDIDRLVEVVGVASALGTTSAYTWLKLPAPEEPERMMAATTLPALLLGGDPGERADEVVSAWQRAMEVPHVRGLMAGRALLFPFDGDVERWVDNAVEIVHSG